MSVVQTLDIICVKVDSVESDIKLQINIYKNPNNCHSLCMGLFFLY